MKHRNQKQNSKSAKIIEVEPQGPPIDHRASPTGTPIEHHAAPAGLPNHAEPSGSSSYPQHASRLPTSDAARLGHSSTTSSATEPTASRESLQQNAANRPQPHAFTTRLQPLPLAARFRAGPALQVRWAGPEPHPPRTDALESRAYGRLSAPLAEKKNIQQ